jgi:hypothetical protein
MVKTQDRTTALRHGPATSHRRKCTHSWPNLPLRYRLITPLRPPPRGLGARASASPSPRAGVDRQAGSARPPASSLTSAALAEVMTLINTACSRRARPCLLE